HDGGKWKRSGRPARGIFFHHLSRLRLARLRGGLLCNQGGASCGCRVLQKTSPCLLCHFGCSLLRWMETCSWYKSSAQCGGSSCWATVAVLRIDLSGGAVFTDMASFP